MTGFMKRGLWIALVGIALGAMAGQAVFAQLTPAVRPGGLDPFVSGSLTGSIDSGSVSIRRPPTRDPVRPTVRSPFIP